MNAETAAFLEKSQTFLVKADEMFKLGWADEAGRAAYLAGFHAAQALISERQGRVPKTHSGVHTQFARLTKDDTRFGGEQRQFLARAYNLKAAADYALGADAVVSPEQASRAIDRAKRFVSAVLTVIAQHDDQASDGGDTGTK